MTASTIPDHNDMTGVGSRNLFEGVEVIALVDRLRESRAAFENYLLAGAFGDPGVVSESVRRYYRGLGRACDVALGLPNGTFAPRTGILESRRRVYLDDVARALQMGDQDSAEGSASHYRTLVETAGPDTTADGSDDADRPRMIDETSARPAIRQILQEFRSITKLRSAAELPSFATASPLLNPNAIRRQALSNVASWLPSLGPAVLAGVHGIILYDEVQPYSAFNIRGPLLVFVSRHTFADAIRAAELVFHECLHQKLNDICVVKQLFRPDYDDAASARVTVPWTFSGQGVRYFSADRCFSAMHVYTHQAFLYLGYLINVLEKQSSDHDEGRVESAMRHIRSSWARANHFRHGIRAPEMQAELGADGHALAEWLTVAVDRMAVVELPDGSPVDSDLANVFDDPHDATTTP